MRWAEIQKCREPLLKSTGPCSCKFMEESSHIRASVKGLQGVGISASLWLPIGLKSYQIREWKQIHEPKGRTQDTSKRTCSTLPLPWGQCGMAFYSHPSWNWSPIAFLLSVSSSISLSLSSLWRNTWVPLLFYCLSTPVKVNVRPRYKAYTTLVLHMINPLQNKRHLGRCL